MAPWRRLRAEQPGLFSGLMVWQQPAAFCDAVLHSWLVRHESLEFPQVIRLVDAFAGGWTEAGKEQMWLLQQMQACVAPGCTAVSQITDTGLAASAKQAAETEKEHWQNKVPPPDTFRFFFLRIVGSPWPARARRIVVMTTLRKCPNRSFSASAQDQSGCSKLRSSALRALETLLAAPPLRSLSSASAQVS